VGSALKSGVGSFSPVRYAHHLGLLDEARARGVEHDAAVLLADISGFTVLAEQLADSHADAPERLTRILNDYFGRLIDRVHDSRGAIVTFVGDALIAAWPVGSDRRDAAVEALACALRMRDDIRRLRAPNDAHLETKIAIGLGRATAARVGGFAGKWRIVAGGEPVTQVCDAIALCKPGDVVASREMWACVADVARGETLEHGVVRIDDAELAARPAGVSSSLDEEVWVAPEALRGFVADPVLHRLDAGQEGWLADLRHVTCMFVRLRPLDWRRPDAWLLLQTALTPIQKRIHDYGGSFDKVFVDEKGTSVIAAFGLPPATTDRAEQRAVAAALAIAADTRAQGLQCDIGIASGPVFCGPVGNEERREYSLIGRTMNLAARLMQRADAGVVCDEPTYARAGAVAGARSATTVTLKGFAEPVAAYAIDEAVREAAPAISSQTAAVGREREIGALTDLYEQLLGGTGGVIVLEGEAGIGKSRIAEVAMQLAASRGIRCLRAAGQAIETLSPWHAWRTVFGDLFAIDARASPAERAGRLAGELGRYGASLDLMPLLNPVFALELPDTDVTHPMVGEARASSARGLLASVLKRVSGSNPLAIIVDDAHWLDSASWQLLAEAVRASAAIAIVVMTRPIVDGTDAAREIFRAAGSRHLRIPSLEREQVREFLSRHFDRERLEDPLIQWLYEHGEGNPYLTQELAFALREAGVFGTGAGLTDADLASRLAGLALPRSVEQIVAVRIDRLAPAEQMVLKTASVIGPTFSLDVLEKVHPIESDKPRLAEIADALVAAHMLEPIATEAGTYGFRHRITQEGAYSMMLGEQRRSLHERVAHEIERRHSGALAPHFAVLAHHWTAAEVDGKALYYLEAAGDRSLESGSYLEAYGLFSKAVGRAAMPSFDASLAGADRRAVWHRNLAEAHYGLGNAGDNIAECKRALSLLGLAVPAGRAAGFLALLRHGVAAASWSVLPRRFSIVRTETERKRVQTAAMAAHRLANAAWMENDTQLTFLGTVMAYRVAIRTDPFVNSARCTAALALVLGLSRLAKRAKASFERSIAEAESIEDYEGLTYAHYARALYLATVGGHWAQVDADVDRALELTEKLGDVQETQITLVIAAMSRLLRGDFHASGAFQDRLLELAIPRRHHEHVAWAYEGRSYSLLRQGHFEEATDCARRSRALLPRLQVGGVSLLNAALGAVFVPAFNGDWDDAVAHLPEAKNAIEALHVPFWAATISLDLFGDALDDMLRLPAGRFDAATLRDVELVFVKGLSSHARRVPNASAVALLHRARAAQRAGRRARAVRLASSALERGKKLGCPFDSARARLLLAQLDGARSNLAREHLDAAAGEFEHCGALPYLARCRRLAQSGVAPQ
jgi:class 3 adenylate cyclase/tetratricopeptide (TPR) repeat protein